MMTPAAPVSPLDVDRKQEALSSIFQYENSICKLKKSALPSMEFRLLPLGRSRNPAPPNSSMGTPSSPGYVYIVLYADSIINQVVVPILVSSDLRVGGRPGRIQNTFDKGK